MNWFKKKVVLILILALAVFLRFYKINELFSFNGDVARDYLSARDIPLFGKIPLVGLASSVPWLHQGALFIYILSLALWLGKYNPVSGVIFVALLGITSVYILYVLGKTFFNKKTGLWAAFFYAVSPLVVIFDRYPYHQSPISLFTLLFFLSLFKAIKKQANYFLLASFIFGLLMQLELSNLVLVPVILVVFWLYKKKISLKKLILSIFLFLVPWIPKIIYDFSNGFTQTLGFAAWIIHKIIPIDFVGNNPSVSLPIFLRFFLVAKDLSSLIFPTSISVSILLFFSLIAYFFLAWKKKPFSNPEFLLIFLWLVFPFFGFLIHGSPSVSYVPVLFGLPAILFGYFMAKFPILKLKTTVKICFSIFVLFNGFYLINNNFSFLTPKDKLSSWSEKPLSFSFYKEVSWFIAHEPNKDYTLVTLGKLAEFDSNLDSFVYLNWLYGQPVSDRKQDTSYLIYYNFDKDKFEKKLIPNTMLKTFNYFTIQKKIYD